MLLRMEIQRKAYNFRDLTGARFGRLTVIRRAPDTTGRKVNWLCRCECGKEKPVRASSLVNGRATSCGCLQREVAAKSFTTHGGTYTPEYQAWASMIQRCTNENCSNWHNYGGRGIAVCAAWLNSFEAFLAHIGKRPSGQHSLDRIDVNGNYEPGNVRWATLAEQRRNIRRGLRRKRKKVVVPCSWPIS